MCSGRGQAAVRALSPRRLLQPQMSITALEAPQGGMLQGKFVGMRMIVESFLHKVICLHNCVETVFVSYSFE
jgi:hypothetical protein